MLLPYSELASLRTPPEGTTLTISTFEHIEDNSGTTKAGAADWYTHEANVKALTIRKDRKSRLCPLKLEDLKTS